MPHLSRLVPVLAACSVLLGAGAARAELRRHTLDDQSLAELEVASPDAAKRFAEGERLLALANLKGAEAEFAAVRALVPKNGMAARRHAQVLAELGCKAEAIAACQRALLQNHNPIDGHACIAPLLVGSGPPTVDEMVEAIELADFAKLLTKQPFGDAASCEIAYRIGDDAMLQHCVEHLKDLAPEHYEARRWAAALPKPRQWPRWLGLGALALAGLGTLAHWLRALGARRTRAALPITAVLVLGFVAPARAEEAAPKPAHWQLSQKFPIDPDSPEKSVPSVEERNHAPLEFGYYLQDLAAEGSEAEKKQDFAKAARFWATLVKAVPDVATGYRRACKAYEAAGDLAKAIDFCGAALNQADAIVDDFGAQARLVLSKPTLLPTDVSYVDTLAKHLQDSKEGQPGVGLAGAHISCELGLRVEDIKRLDVCTKTLAQAAPHDIKTLSFRWSYAMLRHDYTEARGLLPELKKAGMPDAALQQLTAATAEASVWWRRPGLYAAAGGVGLLLAGWLLLKRKKQTPAPAAGPSASPA